MIKILLVGLLLHSFVQGWEVYDITEAEYKAYKENPKEGLKKFEEKFLKPKVKTVEVKKQEVKVQEKIEIPVEKVAIKEPKIKATNEINATKVEKIVTIDSNIELQNETNTTQKEQITQQIVEKIPQKSENSIKIDENISEKAHSKEIMVLYSLQETIDKLDYVSILEDGNLDLLISSLHKHVNDRGNEIDINEIRTVLNGIKKKKFTPFESNLYLSQIKTLLRD